MSTIGWTLPPGTAVGRPTLFQPHAPRCRDPALAVVGRPTLPLPSRPFLKPEPAVCRLFGHNQKSWELPGGKHLPLVLQLLRGGRTQKAALHPRGPERTFTSSGRGSPQSGYRRSHHPKTSAPTASAATTAPVRAVVPDLAATVTPVPTTAAPAASTSHRAAVQEGEVPEPLEVGAMTSMVDRGSRPAGSLEHRTGFLREAVGHHAAGGCTGCAHRGGLGHNVEHLPDGTATEHDHSGCASTPTLQKRDKRRAGEKRAGIISFMESKGCCLGNARDEVDMRFGSAVCTPSFSIVMSCWRQSTEVTSVLSTAWTVPVGRATPAKTSSGRRPTCRPCARAYGTGRVLFYLRPVVVTDFSGAGSEHFMVNCSWLDPMSSTSVSQRQIRTEHGTEIPASSPALGTCPFFKGPPRALPRRGRAGCGGGCSSHRRRLWFRLERDPVDPQARVSRR